MLIQLFNNPILYSLALTLLHFLWQGLLIALVLKSVLILVSKNRSLLRYSAASFAMLISLITPLLTFYVIYASTTNEALAISNQPQLAYLINELSSQSIWFDYQALMSVLPEFLTYILPYISMVWFVVVLFLALKLCIELNNVNQLPKKGSVEPSSELSNRFKILSEQIGLMKVPKLLISLHVDVPMVIGWLKPVVLLPASMVTGLNTSQLEMLILHELAHIRRHDYVVNFLQTIVEILFFFHPSVHWISKQMRNEREYCSDDIAVKHCGDAIAYAHTLADTAALRYTNPHFCSKHTHTIPELAMAASGGDLTQRVVRLVNHHCAPNRDIGKWFAALSVIFSILFISSQSLIGLSSLAFWSKNQQAQLKTYDPLIQKNKFENDDVQELAEYSIAGSLLKNYDEGPISAQDPSQSTYKVVLAKQDINEPIMDSQSLIVPILVTKVSNDAEFTSPSKINKKTHKTNIVSNTENTNTAPFNNNGVSDNKIANIKIVRETPKKDNVNKASIKVASSTEPVKVISEKLSPFKKEEKIAKAKAKAKGATTIMKEVVSSPPSPGLMTHNLPNKRVNTTLPMLAETPKSVLMNERHINMGQHNTAQSSITEQHLHALNSQLMKSTIAEQDTLTEYKIVKYNAIETNQEPIRHDAKQLKVVNPVYPSMAKRKGIEIEVKLNFTIDVDGQIKDINFARQNKVNYFKSSIRSAIKQWRFSPAKLNNRPIQSNMSKIFSFNLQS